MFSVGTKTLALTLPCTTAYLEPVMAWTESESPKPQNHAAGEEELPAVFWDKMPSDENNADLAAINALIEEQTPAERAESHKVQRQTWQQALHVTEQQDRIQGRVAEARQ